MKKTLVLFSVLLCSLTVFAQGPNDTITLKHDYYTTLYSKVFNYPLKVEWWDTKARVGCSTKAPRVDKFTPDPLLPKNTDLAKSYVGSGTDRGHMCPAADNQCLPNAMPQCFYFSNMAPQYHSLNAGDWKTLEERTRDLAIKYDSIHVWCGSVGMAKKVGDVAVPVKCWKVIWIKATKTYEAYIFNNTTDHPKGLDAWKVKVSDVEALTGFKIQ